jgi:hypothetical protein
MSVAVFDTTPYPSLGSLKPWFFSPESTVPLPFEILFMQKLVAVVVVIVMKVCISSAVGKSISLSREQGGVFAHGRG